MHRNAERSPPDETLVVSSGACENCEASSVHPQCTMLPFNAACAWPAPDSCANEKGVTSFRHRQAEDGRMTISRQTTSVTKIESGDLYLLPQVNKCMRIQKNNQEIRFFELNN